MVRCDNFVFFFSENPSSVGCSLDLDARLPPGLTAVAARSAPPGVGVVGRSLDLDARLPPRLTAAAAGSAPPGAGAFDGNV